MTISEQTIRLIKESITPVQAIEYYTGQQAERGRYLCPFHPDRHDVIDFVMKYFGIGFQDAVCRISDDFGLDIDLPDIKNVNPEEALWRKIQVECNKDNKRQITDYRQVISDKIDTLTSCHRVLMQHGAPAEVLKAYCQEIDALIEKEAFWR